MIKNHQIQAQIHTGIAIIRGVLFPLWCTYCRKYAQGPNSIANLCPQCHQSLWSPMKSQYYLAPSEMMISLITIGWYRSALRNLVQRAKFLSQASAVASLTELTLKLLQHYPIEPAHMILSAPPSYQGLISRCFDLPQYLAQQISQNCHIPYQPRGFHRHRHVQPQLGLSQQARTENLRHAFQLRVPVKGKNILIIDDVHTTGTTIRCLSRLLCQAQAQNITALTLAKTGATES